MHKAELVIFDKTYPILDFELTLEKEADTTGLPVSNPFGGKMTITFASSKDDTDLIEAAMASRMMIRGIVRMYRRDGIQKLFDYEFANAYLLLRTETFDATSKNPLTTKIIIAPGILKKEDWIFENYWNPSNPFLAAATPISSSDDVVPQITSLQWVNSDTEEQDISSISYKENASLLAVIENAEGGTATITIEKEDGTEFENGQKQLSFTEAIDENGMVELTPMEIKEQWEEFKTSDMDKLVAKVSHGEAAKTSIPLVITPKPQLVAHFRPITTWNGDKYGFDWMRNGDSGLTGDTAAMAYKDIIGDYFITPSTPPGAPRQLASDGEISKGLATFVKNNTTFTNYEKEFNKTTIPWKLNSSGKPHDYYIPWLSILRIPTTHPDYDSTKPDPIIEVTLIVEVKNIAHNIKIEYDNTFFELSATGATIKKNKNIDQLILPSSINQIGTQKLNITIKNISTFSSDQHLEVFSEEKLSNGTLEERSIGKMIAVANAKKNRKKTKILLVNVKTKIGRGAGKNGLNNATKLQVKSMLKGFLNQALIIPKYDATDLDLRTDIAFNNKYAPSGIFSPSVIHSELDKAFFYDDPANPTIENSTKSKYRDYFRIYFIGESCGSGAYGQAEAIGADTSIVYCDGLTDTTAAHELYHAMGLYHSFSNLGSYTYKYGKTDCIMDYSDIVTPALPVIQFFKWQWKVLWGNPKIKNE